MTVKNPRPTWTPGQREHLNKIENALRYAVKKALYSKLELVAVKGRILAIEKKLEAPATPKENQA